MADYLSTNPWEGVLGDAEQQTGLQPGLLGAIASQENVNPRHNNPLGLSTDSGVMSFSPDGAVSRIYRQAQLLNSTSGPYKDFARTGSIDDLARVYSPPGASNDVYGTNSSEASGIRAALGNRYLSTDPAAGQQYISTDPSAGLASAPSNSIPSPTLSQEVGPPQATPAATDARTQHLIDSSRVNSQRDLEDIAASLPGYRQSRDASPIDDRDKIAIALDHNLSPFLDHPLQSAYNMVVPNKQDFEAIGNLVANPSQAFSRNGPPVGSQEYLDQAVGYALPLLGLGKEAFRGAGALEPRPEVPVTAEAPKPEAAAPAPQPAPAHPMQPLVDAMQAEIDKANAAIGKPAEEAPRVSPETGQVFYPNPEPSVQGETARFGNLTPTGEHAITPNEEANLATTGQGNSGAALRPEREPPPGTGAETSPAPGLLPNEGATERPDVAPIRESSSVAGQGEQGLGAEAGQSPVDANDSLGVTGVSRAARDAAGEVDRTPASVLSVQDHVQNGQRLEAQGADPLAVVKDAVDKGSFSRDATDLAIKRDSDLTKDARMARRAADQAPGDRTLSAAADAAEKAQQQWEDYAIRPIRGQFADTGLSLQTAIDLDTGDYVDYRKQFAKQNGREPTPVEAQQLQGATRAARKLSDANSADLSRIEKAAKPKRIMNRDELRDSLSKTKAQALADCLV